VGYTAQNMPGDYMTSDQRFAATRPDVLVYRTRPLEQDLCVAGPVGVELHVATTGTAADFVVKLIDVYPGDHPNHDEAPGDGYPVEMGGYQQLVRGEPFRGRFREGFEREVPFVPGEPAEIRFQMPDVSHCFRTAHAVMVHVQSSWFPFIDRNPQTFVRIPDAVPEDFQAATHSVFRSAARPSALVLGVRR
jgi:putative CocE/NonD family hydrolase